MKFIDIQYSWKNLTLWELLTEGNIPFGWEELFEIKDIQNELLNISKHLEIESENHIIYPPINQVFRSFIPLQDISVVILGQDPYFSGTNEYDGSAIGLSFSVKPGNKINPSLKNIYKQLKNEKFNPVENGDISHLIKQGVFLLNTALTVRFHSPDTHTKYWYNFTKYIINYLSKKKKNIIWVLLGNKSQSFEKYIEKEHYIIKTSHPSPFSCSRKTKKSSAFFGSNIFTNINNILENNNKNKIIW